MMFLLKRLGWTALTFWLVFTITFFLMQAVPGGPFSTDRQVSPAVLKNLEKRFNLDEPLYVQYAKQLGSTIMLDLGPSYRLVDFNVNEIIASGFPVSAALGLFAMWFALVFGILAGVFSAVYRRTWIDVGLMAVATIGIAVPNFVFASLSIMLFVFVLHWLPPGGWGTLEQLVLPSICLGMPYAAYIARLLRTGMLEVLNQDYIRTAKAKGLSQQVIIFRHALKGAMLPVISFLGPAVAGILTGSLVIERIFGLPGLGSHFIQAATQRDYLLAMGMVLVYWAMLSVMNLIVDLSYRYFDPRIRME